ncbi:hypothetical protein C8J56DRAFT_1166273 [Mycena floridula]|nr:hypothetical protein C8J56DRAFT_1166273 [Mycena floridula]
MGLTLEVIQLIAVFVSSLIQGAYWVSVPASLRCLLWNDRSKRLRSLQNIHWLLLLATTAIFIASSLNLFFGMYRSVSALILYSDPTLSAVDFKNVSDWINIVKSACVYTIIFFGDGILIYRCWVVFDRQYIFIAFPALLWVADAVCAVVLIWIQATVTAKSLVNAGKLDPFLTAYTALTIPLNVITTSMIVLRIWHIDRANAKFRSERRSTLKHVMRMLIESGLLYTATAIATFACYLSGSNAFYISTSIQAPVTGIAMNLILIRAHGQSKNEYTVPGTSTGMEFLSAARTDETETRKEIRASRDLDFPSGTITGTETTGRGIEKEQPRGTDAR